MTLAEKKAKLKELVAQVDELRDEIEQLEEEEEAMIRPWRAGPDKVYYLISMAGKSVDCREQLKSGDKDRFDYGNYYRSAELAEQDAKELRERGKLRQLRDMLCPGYKYSGYGESHTVVCDTKHNKYVWVLCGFKQPGAIYFDTCEHARQAADWMNKHF